MQLGDCPSSADLSAYVLGKLPEETSNAISVHLDGCILCQAQLPSLNDQSDSLVPFLRKVLLPIQAEFDPELQSLLAQTMSVSTGRQENRDDAGSDCEPTRQVKADSAPTAIQLDHYRLLELIGQGGMGTVHKALHTQLDKIVALKILSTDREDSPEAVARFQREMKAVGRLDHPNIVRAIDAREANGVHFLVMDFVPGMDLAKLVQRRHPLSVTDACELVRQTALGLQHVHEHGLVHRDIKPSNLMLSQNGQLKILDLGLARALPVKAGEEGLTQTGMIMGTADYMAPEQATDASSVDIRADLYSLGCTLYHLLAGQPPFGGPDFRHFAQKLAAHLQESVPPIRRLRSDVPPELNTLMRRMMAKKPADRFDTPNQVARALKRFTVGCDLARLLLPDGQQVASESDVVALQPTISSAHLDTSLVPKPSPAPIPSSIGSARKRRFVRLALTAAGLLICLAAAAIVWKMPSHSKPQPNQETLAQNPNVEVLPQTGENSEVKNPPAELASGAQPPDAHTSKPASADTADLASQGFGLLKKYCYRCHGIDFKVPGYNVLDRTILVAIHDKDEPPYITPGNPDKSLMWQRVGIDKDMPPSGARPSESESQQLKRWIEAGAPFPGRPSRFFKAEKDILLTVKNHLSRIDQADRRFQRYFTLTHLYNNKDVSADELRLYRAAFAKLANSLSWKNTIVVPRAVDPEETIYNIDLRTLGWDEKDLWKEILKVYPYGLTHNQDADPETRKLAGEVYDFAGNELPYLRADWFVATAGRPPLYHTLLQLPNQSQVLEAQLRVNASKDFLENQLARAGLLTSGVSKQNRLLDRHNASYGAYWKSYDFRTNEGTANLVRFPLGPVFRDNPFLNQAFEHAGGEIIFNLPNGLQGYLLIDNQGRRIDEGPIAIVSDSQETAGTPAIVNGLSCMACHKHGMIRFEDKLRAGSAVTGGALIKVQALYRTKDEMKVSFERDENRFLVALAAATGQFLMVDDDKGKTIGEFPEPIGASARLYVKDLSLMEVAMELGFSDPQKLRNLIETNRKLRELGLAPLLEGGAVKRELWSSQKFTTSLFHNASRELGLGTPYLAF